MDLWHFPNVQNPISGRDRRKEDPQELAESHAYCGDRARLNDQEQRPAVKKTPQRPKRFAKIDILSAGSRHHSRQFAITESGDDGHESRDCPRADQ